MKGNKPRRSKFNAKKFEPGAKPRLRKKVITSDPKPRIQKSERPSSNTQGLEESNEEGRQNRDDIIYGRHTVIAAIENERPLNRIWIVPQIRQHRQMNELLSDCKSRGVVIDEVTSLRLDQMTFQANHQGIVAQVGACHYLDLAELTTKAIAQTTSPVLIAVDGITDPHNLGAIIRSAEAMGIQGVVLPQRRCASVGGTVAKVAAGALESLPIARVVNLNQALEALKESGFWIYGLTLDACDTIQSVDLRGSVVLVIGSEEKGLSAVTQKHCDGMAKIPLIGRVQSLNASVAAGIGIYEILRQRQAPAQGKGNH